MDARAFVALWAAVSLTLAAGNDANKDGDWRAYGGDPGGGRFSSLAEIDRGNAARLVRAWTYHTGDRDARPGAQPFAFECTPLAVDGRLYVSTPSGRVIALDGDSGREGWRLASPPGPP